MSKYPKALEEFFNTVPEELKTSFNKLANTATGKKFFQVLQS